MKSLILALIPLVNLFATEINYKNYYKGEINLNIIKVAEDDFNSFLLTNENYREMRLVCANNMMYRNKRPFIIYKNYYGIEVEKFYLSDNGKCSDLIIHLTAIFEGIDAYNPMDIVLDKKNRVVKNITLPDLDPFEDGLRKDDFPSNKKKFKNNEETYDSGQKLVNLP